MAERNADATPCSAGSWCQSRRQKLVQGLRAAPAERLAWLEQARRLALASGALARRLAQKQAAAPAW